MAFAIFNPRQLVVTLGGLPLGGWSDSMLRVERDGDDWRSIDGCDGEVALVKLVGRAATIELPFLASSVSNDLMSGIRAGGLAGLGPVPFGAKDSGGIASGVAAALGGGQFGRTVLFAETAWIVMPPAVRWSGVVEERVWTIRTDDLTMFVGGFGNVDVLGTQALDAARTLL